MPTASDRRRAITVHHLKHESAGDRQSAIRRPGVDERPAVRVSDKTSQPAGFHASTGFARDDAGTAA